MENTYTWQKATADNLPKENGWYTVYYGSDIPCIKWFDKERGWDYDERDTHCIMTGYLAEVEQPAPDKLVEALNTIRSLTSGDGVVTKIIDEALQSKPSPVAESAEGERVSKIMGYQSKPESAVPELAEIKDLATKEFPIIQGPLKGYQNASRNGYYVGYKAALSHLTEVEQPAPDELVKQKAAPIDIEANKMLIADKSNTRNPKQDGSNNGKMRR